MTDTLIFDIDDKFLISSAHRFDSLTESVTNIIKSNNIGPNMQYFDSLTESVTNVIKSNNIGPNMQYFDSLTESITNIIKSNNLELNIQYFDSLTESVTNVIKSNNIGPNMQYFDSLTESITNIIKSNNLESNIQYSDLLKESMANIIKINDLKLNIYHFDSLIESIKPILDIITSDVYSMATTESEKSYTFDFDTNIFSSEGINFEEIDSLSTGKDKELDKHINTLSIIKDKVFNIYKDDVIFQLMFNFLLEKFLEEVTGTHGIYSIIIFTVVYTSYKVAKETHIELKNNTNEKD
ncbi:hypothetical protein OZX68_02140 [Streptococcaceae bacterium ESL0729]|nr:hypothetical protein OZX68_02140 [Streptococcaceae bacterium ESL0729]